MSPYRAALIASGAIKPGDPDLLITPWWLSERRYLPLDAKGAFEARACTERFRAWVASLDAPDELPRWRAA